MNSTLVYYASVGEGGLSHYAVCQMLALRELGINIHCLGYDFIREEVRKKAPEIQFTVLREEPGGGSINRWRRAFNRISLYREHIRTLERVVKENGYRKLLISSYVEYFSPLWVWRLRRLHRSGVRIGVVVHDPVRDFVIGPKWWHNWSVSLAYSFVNLAFVHDHTKLDTGWPKRNIKTEVIPHGPYVYPCPSPAPTKEQLREEFDIPQDALVLLNFGHIRDGKNLDLAIKVLVEYPDCHLIIAGREQSSGQKPAQWYRQLAEDKGVAERCHWFTEFIPDDDVHRFFLVSDIVLLLYSRDFHSASGVLNIAVNFQRPCLASSGEGPLKTAVEKYQLGVFVEPDSYQDLSEGISVLCRNKFSASCLWSQYLSENSWKENAQIVLSGIFNYENK